MICTQCGINNARDSKFCKSCGKKIAAATPPPEAIQHIERSMEEALVSYQTGQLDFAIGAVNDVLEVDPDNPSALSLKAMIYEKLGEIPLAIDCYEKVVKLNPESISDKLRLENLKNPDSIMALPTKKQNRFERKALAIFSGLSAALLVIVIGVVYFSVSALNKVNQLSNTQQIAAAPPTVPTTDTGSNGVKIEASRNSDPNASANLLNPDANNPLANVAPPIVNGHLTNPPQQQRPIQTKLSMNHSAIPIPRENFKPLMPLTIQGTLPQPKVNEKTKPVAPAKKGAPAPAADGSMIMPSTDDSKRSPENAKKPIYDIKVTNGKGSAPTGNSGHANIDAVSEAEAFESMGREYQLGGNYKQAVNAYQKALAGKKDHAKLYQQIGTCYRYLGETANASSYFQKAIAAYQSKIARGQDVAESNSGLKTCELNLAMVKNSK